MRWRWFIVMLGLLLVLAGGALAWRRHGHQAQQREQFAEWQELQEVESRLNQLVEVRPGQRVPLKKWLDEFSRQTGLQIVMHGEPEYYSAEQRTIDLEVSQLPARNALDELGRACECTWRPDGAKSIGFYPCDLLSVPPTIRTYQIDQSFSPELQQQIAEAVKSVVGPDSWSDVGGPGELVASPGRLVIAQRYDLHEPIREFLIALQDQLRLAAELPAVGLSADDPRLQSFALTAQARQFERTHTALEQRVSFNFNEKPLSECLAYFERVAGVKIRIPEMVAHELYPAKPVTLQLENVRLSMALELLLRDLGAFATTTFDGSALRIATFDQEESPENMLWRAYPVPDFRQAVRPELDPVAELLMNTIEADMWQDVGGPGSVQRIGNLLLVSQANRVHQKIPGFLHALRKVRAGEQSSCDVRSFSADREETLKRLQRPLALKYEDVALQEMMADLANRAKLRIVLTKRIEDVGIDAKTPVTCDLPERELEDNLYALLRPLDLGFEVREDYLAITTADHVNSPDNLETEILDVRPLLLSFSANELMKLLKCAVEPDNWSDVGGPASIEEFRGLLIVQGRPEILAQVRHVLAVIEQHLRQRAATTDYANLLTRSPRVSFPNTPLIHMYVVDDLLLPRDQFSGPALIEELSREHRLAANRTSGEYTLDVIGNRFLVAALSPEFVAPLEAKLSKLRMK